MEDTEAAATAFRAAALAYMTWMDHAGRPETSEVNLSDLHAVLAALQRAAAELPAVRLSEAPEPENVPEYDHKEAHTLASSVASKLPVNAYSVVFNALDEEDRGSIMTTLDDDLGDIYASLKDALLLVDALPLSDAMWQWRFDYYTHWGRHLVHAQTAIFSFLGYSGH